MPSTNAALADAGYTTAPSTSYGCKLVLRDGDPVGHFDCVTAWDLPGMREAGIRLDDRLAVFDRACVLASRTGRPLDVEEMNALRRLILAGATDAEAALADLRRGVGAVA